MLFLLLSACFARRHRRRHATNAVLEDFLTETKLAGMVQDWLTRHDHERQMERLVTSRIEAAMPEHEVIKVPRSGRGGRRYWPSGSRQVKGPNRISFTQTFQMPSGRVRGRRYTYENYPGVLIKPEQIFFPGVTDVMGPIASSRKLPSCLSSVPDRERVMKLGSATGMFPQHFD